MIDSNLWKKTLPGVEGHLLQPGKEMHVAVMSNTWKVERPYNTKIVTSKIQVTRREEENKNKQSKIIE